MIKLSQTGYYALHAVLYIAVQKELVKIKDIAEKE
jgi:DNA-binding IscR family transcriptional regulator